MEDKISKFINNKRAIRFATVMILFFISLHFLFIGLFEANLLEEVFSFGSETLNRVLSMVVGLGIAIVTYGAYKQDREIVNKRLRALKKKISEEAREIRADLENKSTEEETLDEEVVEPIIKNSKSEARNPKQ